MFKTMEHCSKPYDIKHVNSRKLLVYQHQWEEQKKTDNLDVPKVDKNDWSKTMENVVLYLKIMRGVRGVLLAWVVRQHVKVTHISSWYSVNQNLGEKMIARAPITDTQLTLKLTWYCLDGAYVSCLCDTFKINNSLAHHILSKIFTSMGTYVYMKQRKSMQDGQAVFYDIHKQFLSHDHVTR